MDATEEELYYGRVAYEAARQGLGNTAWPSLTVTAREDWTRISMAARAAVYVDPIAELRAEVVSALGSDDWYQAIAKRMYELGARPPTK